ncbi:hypothetical protein KKE74_02720 [Patescibacteria group bacterium]|nr:hypothetical protein [Patescibacteria group bacterium]MBU2472920.1 hypothetical protein [Patescibacteria group bacterium]
MPTLNQIKSIQKINDPLIRQRYLKYFQLPQDIREIFFAAETADKVYDVAQKNNLNENQLWWASHTAGMIILGETNIVDFVKTLQEKCELTEEPARQLARDINQAIFLPVKEDLKKIHKVPQWPREDETKETQVSPKIEGNVVNLKEQE